VRIPLVRRPLQLSDRVLQYRPAQPQGPRRVSIETDAEDVDIWTPVAQEIGVPIEEIEIEM